MGAVPLTWRPVTSSWIGPQQEAGGGHRGGVWPGRIWVDWKQAAGYTATV